MSVTRAKMRSHIREALEIRRLAHEGSALYQKADGHVKSLADSFIMAWFDGYFSATRTYASGPSFNIYTADSPFGLSLQERYMLICAYNITNEMEGLIEKIQYHIDAREQDRFPWVIRPAMYTSVDRHTLLVLEAR